MDIGDSLLEDQGLKLKVLYNASRLQVKVFLDNLSQHLGRLDTRTVVEYINAVWLRQTNGNTLFFFSWLMSPRGLNIVFIPKHCPEV